MNAAPVWCCLAAAICLLCPTIADAQIFSPPIDRLVFLTQRVERLTVGTYWSQWEFPSVRLAGFTAQQRTEPSPLLTADYFLTQDLAIGGWWNRIRGEDRQRQCLTLDEKLGDFDFTVWDAHVTYHLPDQEPTGWAFQLGYGELKGRQRVNLPTGFGCPPIPIPTTRRRFDDTFRSLNFWVVNTQRLSGQAITSRHPVYVYATAGYFTSPEFGHTNLIVGGSVGLSPQISLSGSVWLNNLDNLSVRTTLGLVGQF
jgi:hypothetical protein